ncbi:MAG: zinc ribbon domain-containing protein [Promethearchaeota archaeon]|nr:MAG: zinc ribbon domain-containing protein [Candidatus Lokiarchaeota archaeon]
MNYCPECGSELMEIFNICPYCGFSLSQFSKKIEKNIENKADVLSQKNKKIQELEAKINKLEKKSQSLGFGAAESWPFFIVFFFIAGFFLIFFFIMFFILRH